jgi:hypothetical protein
MKLIGVIDLELEKEDFDTQLHAFVALSIHSPLKNTKKCN